MREENDDFGEGGSIYGLLEIIVFLLYVGGVMAIVWLFKLAGRLVRATERIADASEKGNTLLVLKAPPES